MNKKHLTEEDYNVIIKDFQQTFFDIKETFPAISIFGSARLKEDSPFYSDTVKISQLLSKIGFNIITGGGPGIMEAGNKGADFSYGLNIKLPYEQKNNPYISKPLVFSHFFSRKIAFINNSCGFIAMPGGFGTLDEITEVLVLMSTNKIPYLPIVLYGKEYWTPFIEMTKQMLKYKCINIEELNFLLLVDSIEEIEDIFTTYFKKLNI